MRSLRRGGFRFDIVGRLTLWLVVMGVVIGVSIASLGIRQLNLGIEFKGGTAFRFQAERDVDVADVRDLVRDTGVAESKVQRAGENGFFVETPHLGVERQQEVSDALASLAGIDAQDISIEDVGPTWGQQVTSKALRALLIFLVVAVIYISIRLEPKMAGAALVALVHDTIATAGIYSLTGFEVTPATVIAFLTILGYSLYDTVVIFDRVKERGQQLSAAGRLTYSQMANESLNQVLVRSINTSITSLIPVGTLLFVGSYLLGAETLRELALALFIGLAAGTYSSIFVATPILAAWKEREPRWATLRARIAARTGETTAPPPRGTEAEDEPEEPEVERAAIASSQRGPRPGPQARPPRKRGKRKRRRR